jgi:hypothetical protein
MRADVRRSAQRDHHEVEDLGLQETQFGTKDMAVIYFTADDQKEGKPVNACMKVIQSLHPKSNLTKLLTQLSVPFGDTFDLNVLIRVKCRVVVQHKERDGKAYANIAAVLKLHKPAGSRSPRK